MAGSLRTGLIVGALLWGVGLIALTLVIGSAVVNRYPHAAQVLHVGLLSMVAVSVMIVGWSYLRRSVSPVVHLRTRLADVREGRARHVTGEYPNEVRPLVDELNALIDDRDASVARALAKAGDLAHGLKTPLAVLSREADEAEAAGQMDLAETVRREVERMRRHVSYHLAHARAAASSARAGTRSVAVDAAHGLVRALVRLHADRGVAIEVDMDPSHAVRCQREDLEEMLGNLLDNACRAARTRVRVRSTLDGLNLILAVDDDGPGLEPALSEAVLERGVRADEREPGSGLGLAIVRDLAELYGGSIALTRSTLGGLKAALTLPAA